MSSETIHEEKVQEPAPETEAEIPAKDGDGGAAERAEAAEGAADQAEAASESAGEESGTEPAGGEEPAKAAPSETEVLQDRLLRLQADFANYRRRVARDHQELVEQAGSEVLAAMLSPMDHLELAIETMAKAAPEDDAVLRGVRMVRDELLAVFERFALRPVDTKIGAELDPGAEEALGMLPGSGLARNRVAAVVRRGYTLHGKILRAAQVMVGSEEPADAGVPEGAGEEA